MMTHLSLVRIAQFIGIAFGVSWLLAGGFYALGGRWNTPAALAVASAYMMGPAIAAVLVQRVIHRQPLRAPLGLSLRLQRWWLVAWLAPPLLALAALGTALLLPGVTLDPAMTDLFRRFEGSIPPEQLAEMRRQVESLPVHPFWLALVQGLVAGPTVNAVVALGEELGWRGFLHKELAPLGFWRASLLIGVIWGVWHAPLILQGHNYPTHPVLGAFLMVLFCVLLAPLFGYVRVRTGSSVAAGVMHGSLNASSGLAVMVLAGGNDLTIGLTGAAGLLVLGAANLALHLLDRNIDVRREHATAATPVDTSAGHGVLRR
ncbi:MAG TPA: CPBP family intramembrane glutamic endopeptidase [Myxococcaceae bacterium]|nr:CPBP family intramembrane glutamic endopeptidase [Myxococcaceae bacterium]